MKNIVSFQTAKRLKTAGFPQPRPKTGQLWYNELGELRFIGRRLASGPDAFYSMSVDSGMVDVIAPILEDVVFAPSATDIMKTLVCYDLGFYDTGEEKTWIVFGLEMEEVALNDNPAEAAALAWLSIHEKDKTPLSY